jgi:tetratricopeptide (TPR) repeat protein
MKGLSQTDLPVFNLLSIGERGVGKTVFLAGSYVELQTNRPKENSQSWWLECRDSKGQENIEGILDYVARMGKYPPPTMKITDFHFSLKSRHWRGEKTLCYFRWWDVPGESCNFRHPAFQKMVMNSHGCCVFLNGEALVNDPKYLEAIENVVKQVVAIASLVKEHGLEYAFALIFTRCDLLEPGPVSQLQIEANLQPLLARLDGVNAKYQRFYSAIPIVSYQGNFRLNASGTAAPLLWLLSELNKSDQMQEQSTLETRLKENLPVKQQSSVKPRKYIPLLVMSSLGLLGVSAALFFAFNRWIPTSELAQTPAQKISQYERILQSDPNNFEALVSLADLYIGQHQNDRALPVLEKIVHQRPQSLDWQFILAQIYENKEQKDKAESVYDRILSQQENNLEALIKKAILRGEQGDTQAAKTLFAKAEKVAPTDTLKQKVRAISQSVLPPK